MPNLLIHHPLSSHDRLFASKSSIFCVLLSILSSVFLLGCAFIDPYQEYGPYKRSGYTDVPLQRNIYKVSYTGTDSDEVIQNYLLRRCSELALQNGYRYFIVLSQTDHTDKSTYITDAVETSYTSNDPDDFFKRKIRHFTPSTTYSVRARYTQTVLIRLLASNRNALSAYDAWTIFKSFKDKEAKNQ